ncbi:uncharacterized protein UTRI_05363 [Ustilago trichophora]|uniref:DUF3835 domain-containing protein n=1 Tax=Ustilago trichophora TaxID=86804 RepID=A0A5C3EM48_9BASI|nr:uncharacterized protein UTRI_05363 [Ustilago trichophora]
MAPSFPPSNMGASGSNSRSLPSTLPSDPSEISATAQALLQAHYGRLKTSTTTTSSTSPSSAMESQHAYLAKLEAAARNIDRICLQLDNLSVTQQLRKGATESATSATTTMQPLGPLAFWPARLVPSEEVFVRQDPDGLAAKDLLALEDQVLPMLTGLPKGGEDVSVNVRLTEPSRTIEVRYAKLGFKDAQSQLQLRKGKFVAEANKLRAQLRVNRQDGAAAMKNGQDVHMVNEDNEVLNEEGLPFYEPVEQISEEEATRKKKAYMQPFVREEDGKTGDKKKRKQWLDDMLSKLEAEEEDEMDSDQEDGAVFKAADANASSTTPSDLDTKASSSSPSPAAEEETRVVLRTRTPSPPPSPEDAAKTKALPEIVSAARPPPSKSALKASALRPAIVQRPSFGSAGIRHGFLNLNPSSPGAIKSSYSWEDLEKEDNTKSAPDSERPSRCHTPTPLSRNASLLSRVTDAANSSPMTSGTSTPTKKSVRIKSPERAHPEAAVGSGLTPLQRALRSSIRVKENYSEPAPSGASQQPGQAVTRSLDAGSGTAEKRHKDDVGVEEEAERIVQLLGPEVVEGHPAAPAPDVLKKMQQAHEEDKRYSTPEAVAARAKAEEEERERERLQRLAEKPALGHAVMERPRPTTEDQAKGLATQVKAQAQQAKFSAFKAGFLNQKPIKFVPNTNVPRKSNATKATVTPPTQSLGMSALDRASLGDEELSERRQQMGLPAAVPHARPSKAFAEKMKMRQEGILPDTRTEEEVGGEGKVTLARPIEGDDVPRAGRVRFGPPGSSEAAMDEDEDGDEGGPEINPDARLENHLPDEVDDGRELDEEQEEPKIEGEGEDTDQEDAYFDNYLSKKRSRAAAAADSRGRMDDDDDEDGDEIDDDDDDEGDDDWDVNDEEFDDDDDDDDDFDYDREDLLDLAPALGATEGLSDNPELMREYEEARAKLAAMGLAMPGRSAAGTGADALRESMLAAAHAGGAEDEEEDDDYEMDVVPLDATMEDPEYQGNTTTSSASGSSRISRFKASLAQRKLGTPKSTTTHSQNLEDLLSSAQNLGSSSSSTSAAFGMDGIEEKQEANAAMMIIPQLAPVRFPKNGDLIEGQTGNGPVDLNGGESDEDDEKAEMVMRSRLERQQWKRENPELAERMKEEEKRREDEGQVAPRIGKGKKKTLEDKDDAVEGVEEGLGKVEEKPKKVSRFKAARMGL